MPAPGRETRRLREASDLTEEKPADRAGVHPNYIGRIERGESLPGVSRAATFSPSGSKAVDPIAAV